MKVRNLPYPFLRGQPLKSGSIVVTSHYWVAVGEPSHKMRTGLTPTSKHRHAKRARVIFLVIGVFVELFTVMVRLSFFGLRCTARRKLEIYNL